MLHWEIGAGPSITSSPTLESTAQELIALGTGIIPGIKVDGGTKA